MTENPISCHTEIKAYFTALNYRGDVVDSSLTLTSMPETLEELEESCEYFGYGDVKIMKLVKVQIKTERTIIEEYELPPRESVNQ